MGEDNIKNFKQAQRRKKKSRVSLTLDTENLEFVKKDARAEGIDDLNLSAFIDMLLEGFVSVVKKENKEINSREKNKKS